MQLYNQSDLTVPDDVVTGMGGGGMTEGSISPLVVLGRLWGGAIPRGKWGGG